jgi:hypothetical protein
VSLIPHPGVAIGERIRKLRQSLPPPDDRATKSRQPYPSQAEFAAMVGTDRFRIIDWEVNGAIPDALNRQRLAEISGLAPEMFLPPGAGGTSAPIEDVEQRLKDYVREESQREIRKLRDELRRELRRQIKDEVAKLREAV